MTNTGKCRLSEKLKTIIFASVYLVLVSGCTGSHKSDQMTPFPIVTEGRPATAIVIGENPGKTEEFAASELKRYVKQMSGAELEIKKASSDSSVKNAILIGTEKTNPLIAEYIAALPENLTKLGNESFSIRVSHGNLIIAGGGETGTLYGVYELLENLGCRWFSPEKLWEIIPVSASLKVDSSISIIGKPSFKGRECWQGLGFEHLDWLARNRCNYLIVPLSVPWHRFSDESYLKAKDELIKRGVTLEAGHDNTINFWLPPNCYFDTHPEYYPLINGQRKLFPLGKKSIGSQFCFSNRECAEEVAANMCKFLDAHPGIKNIGLGISDAKARDAMCQCENCRKLWAQYMEKDSISYSGPFLYFANNVAELVAKQHPDAMITIGAYQYASTFEAPCNIKAAPNLKLNIFLWMRDGARGINSETSSRNSYLMSEIKKWEKVFDPQRIVIADYYYGMAHYKNGIWSMFDVAAQDFQYFEKSHFYGASLAPGFQFSHMINNYVFYRLAWNSTVNLNNVLDDFCQKAFKEASSPMRKYLRLLSDMLENYDSSKVANPFHLKNGDASFLPNYQNIIALFDESRLTALEECINDAKQRACKDKIVTQRLAQVEFEFYRSAYYVRIKRLFDDGGKLISLGNFKEAEIKLNKAKEILDKANNTYKNFNKDFLIPDIDESLRLIRVQGADNNMIKNPSGEKSLNLEEGLKESKAGKLNIVCQPENWSCYHAEGDGKWGSSSKSDDGKKYVFIEATAPHIWPDGKKPSISMGMTPSLSSCYSSAGAFPMANVSTYGLSFEARAVNSPLVKVFVFGWDSKGKRHTIHPKFIKPCNPDDKFQRFLGTFVLPEDIVSFTPVFHISSLGRLEIRDVHMAALKPVVGIYVPDAEISSSMVLAPILRTLLKNESFNISLISSFDNKAKACPNLLFLELGVKGMEECVAHADWIRQYVKDGGNVLFLRSGCGYKPHGWPHDTTIFPEICQGVSEKIGNKNDDTGKKLTVVDQNLIQFDCKGGFSSYWDHYALIKGNDGKVIVVDDHERPVVLAGRFGKGKVIFNGLLPFDGKTESVVNVMSDIEEKILLNSLTWFMQNTDQAGSR